MERTSVRKDSVVAMNQAMERLRLALAAMLVGLLEQNASEQEWMRALLCRLENNDLTFREWQDLLEIVNQYQMPKEEESGNDD